MQPRVSLRIEPELLERAEDYARRDGNRSLASLVRLALAEFLDQNDTPSRR